MPSRCAIWGRVSTDEQESGNQLDELRTWAARRGLDVAAEYIIDGASAWKGKHRDQVAAALANVRLGRFDVLLVWALDRLDREGVEPTLGLLRRFQEAGAPVWSLQESWTETADPHTAELLGAIYAWMARAESARRTERVKAGLARPRPRASRSAVVPGRRTASRASAAGITPAGNERGHCHVAAHDLAGSSLDEMARTRNGPARLSRPPPAAVDLHHRAAEHMAEASRHRLGVIPEAYRADPA